MGEIRIVGPGKADILIRYARKELSVQVKHADILIRYARNCCPIMKTLLLIPSAY